MDNFQNYLDDALKKLDVKEVKNDANIAKQPEYDISENISDLLLTTRKQTGISQHQLSEITGIPQANISKIENGHYIPSLLILKRLADGLGRRLIVDFIDNEMQTEE